MTSCGEDIREAAEIFPAASFDVVTCNPPYITGGHGLVNPEAPMAIARHEVKCSFADVAAAAAKLLVPGGGFFLVHRPFRLAEIMVTLSDLRLEPKRMRLVYPFARQGAEHGPAGGEEGRKKPPQCGKAADRIPFARRCIRRRLQIFTDIRETLLKII